MADSRRLVRRKVNLQSIEAHPSDLALIVSYDVEVAIVNEDGYAAEPTLTERKTHYKTVNVENLTLNTNVHLLAQQIADSDPKLISQAKVPLIENVLYSLQLRLEDAPSQNSRNRPDPTASLRAKRINASVKADVPAEQARLADLPKYISLLYEEIDDCIRGTGLILQLAREPNNLQVLVQDETLLGALTRLLKENAEGYKSMDLVYNIVQSLVVFSHFNQFHKLLSQYHGGALVLRVVELEIKRSVHNQATLQTLESDRTLSAAEKENKRAQIKAVLKRQEKILYVCFHILYNLSQDQEIERKMAERGIVQHLVTMLDRRSAELLILITTFLRKLALYRENVATMASSPKTIETLVGYVPVQNEVLLDSVLRLIFNLSFDARMREQMVKSGLLAKLVSLLQKPSLLELVLRVLYQLSMDETGRQHFTYDAISSLLNLLGSGSSLPALTALLINISASPRNAEVIRESEHFPRLLQRAIKTSDSLLMKIVRNLSQPDGQGRGRFKEYMLELVRLANQTGSSDLLVEVLGTLANLPSSPERLFPWPEALQQNRLVLLLERCMAPNTPEDDTVLEAVQCVGSALYDERCIKIIANSNLIADLRRVFDEKQEDDEIVLQVVFTFLMLVSAPVTRAAVLDQVPQMITCFVDLLHDQNPNIRKLADQLLDVVQESDHQWAMHIRELKFTIHNTEWLTLLNEDDSDGETEFFVADGVADDHAIHPNDTRHMGFNVTTLDDVDDDDDDIL